MNYLQIPVEIDKKNFLVNIPSLNITSKMFLKIALEQSNIEYKSNTYALFELSNGIESLISKNDYVGQRGSNIKFIIRKCHFAEKRLQVRRQNAETIKSYYKKSKIIINKENNFQDIEKKYKNKMIKSENKLRRTTQILMESFKFNNVDKNKDNAKIDLSNLCVYHKNQLNEIISKKYEHNIAFLKFLQIKLQEQNKSDNSRRLAEQDVGSTGCSRSNSFDDIQNSNEIINETWV